MCEITSLFCDPSGHLDCLSAIQGRKPMMDSDLGLSFADASDVSSDSGLEDILG